MNARPVAIDLFAGAGGLSLGFEQAGFDIAASIEVDPIHAATHRFNFPQCAVLPRSVIGLSGSEIRSIAGLGSRPIDVVFGGAPCQGFSIIGQRALDDPRNGLVREFVRIVVELDASYFVFENVKGLTLGVHKRFLSELIGAFEEAGYSARTPWRVLNASHFGVPQDRERLFLLGARQGRKLPQYPCPTSSPAGTMPEGDLLGLLRGPSCRAALEDLPEVDDYPQLLTSDSVRTDRWAAPSEYARALRCRDAISWFSGYSREWEPDLLTSSMRTEHTEISRRRFAETRPGTVEPISRFLKLPPEGVSNTLRAGTDSARGAFTSPRPIHYARPRCVTVREMARLHGFPDWFRFHETKWHGGRQIGNAVPPPLARAIAGEVARAFDYKPTRPQQVLALGDPALLRFDMSQAARYWGVDVPIGKRDRKSGAKKRKQEEIEALRLVARP